MTMRVMGLVLTAALVVSVAGCGGGKKGGKTLTQQYQDASKLTDPGQKAKTLAAIAEKQQKAGDLLGVTNTLTAAKDAARQVKDPVSRAAVLSAVAGACARTDQGEDDIKRLLKDAGKAIEEIASDPLGKIRALATLAAQTGQYLKNPDAAAAHLKKAEETVASVEGARSQVIALASIADAYGKLELAADSERVVGQAKQIAAGQTDPREQAECLSEIGGALFAMKKTDDAKMLMADAEKAAGTIPEHDSQAYALLHIAQKVNLAKHKDEARKLLDKAKDEAMKVSDSSVRAPLVEDIDSALKGL